MWQYIDPDFQTSSAPLTDGVIELGVGPSGHRLRSVIAQSSICFPPGGDMLAIKKTVYPASCRRQEQPNDGVHLHTPCASKHETCNEPD